MKIWRVAGVPGMGLAVSVLAGMTFACGSESSRLAGLDERGGPASRSAVPVRIEPARPAVPASAEEPGAPATGEAATVGNPETEAGTLPGVVEGD